MKIDAGTIISVTDANQNFSRVVRLVEQFGRAVIFRRNRPAYLMLDISDPESIKIARMLLRDLEKEAE